MAAAAKAEAPNVAVKREPESPSQQQQQQAKRAKQEGVARAGYCTLACALLTRV